MAVVGGLFLRPWEVMLFSVFISIVCWIANFVNRIVRQPYMDEIFHVPQAQRYCRGDFASWDPKLTTPPGLYLTSVPFSWLAECTLDVLRATNILFCVANIYVMHLIRQHLHPTTSIMSSVSIALLPVNFFFTFLYYTDAGCIFCLLLVYLFYLNKRHYLSAVAGLAGVVFRQTAIVWVFFVACLTLAEIVERHLRRSTKAQPPKATTTTTTTTHRSRPRTTSAPARSPLVADVMWDAAKDCTGYALVGLAFVVFLHRNGGITLGDKAAHEAVVHFTQIGYFLLFALMFGAPFVLSVQNFVDFIDFATKRPIVILVGSLVMHGLFENFLHVHPYLLSDNRHYTFYLWRRFLSKVEVRQGLIVLYTFVGYCLFACVRGHVKRSWLVLFALCTAITIVPQKLLEFRYFLWPYMLLRLHFREQPHQVAAETVAFVVINSITFYMFLYGTFIWKHDPVHIQRFMW